jgi:hypothetical protein
LVYIKYCLPNNIVLLININKFEPNPILVNINKLKPNRYLGKALRGLESTIEGGGEHKEESQKHFQYGSIKNETTPKIKVN